MQTDHCPFCQCSINVSQISDHYLLVAFLMTSSDIQNFHLLLFNIGYRNLGLCIISLSHHVLHLFMLWRCRKVCNANSYHRNKEQINRYTEQIWFHSKKMVGSHFSENKVSHYIHFYTYLPTVQRIDVILVNERLCHRLSTLAHGKITVLNLGSSHLHKNPAQR